MDNSIVLIKDLLIVAPPYRKHLENAALSFQYGDDFILNNNINPATQLPFYNHMYETIDDSKKIIGTATVGLSNEGVATVCITKRVSKCVECALDDNEFTAFIKYIKHFKVPGLDLLIINTPTYPISQYLLNDDDD